MTQLTATATASQPRRRLTTDEFHRLVESGALREGSRAFLWDGEMIEPMAEGPQHINVSENLREILSDLLPRQAWTVYQDRPLKLRDGFQPQPDLMVLRGPRSGYRDRLPIPADVAILVEVSGSTYAFDSGEYLQGYARVGIAAYWIVNIAGRRIEAYSDPDAEGAYRTRQDYEPGTLVPLEWGAVAVDEVHRLLRP